MNKRFTIIMLLMALFVSWAAKAQETKSIQVTPDRGGDRGTMTVYKRVSSPSSGRNYLILNSATANSDALALSQASSTASTITASFVHINSGISATSNAAYIADVAEPTAVWRATSGWNFSHSKSGTTYYINGSGNILSGYTLSASTSSTNWTYSNNSLSCECGTLFTTTCYITPGTSGFSLGTSSANVYLFEETSITTYNVTASVSPSRIGRVTGAGQYPAGATCTLTASATNSEYAFSNWTVNGIVVSTNHAYSFTVSEDIEVVANFESTASCPSPTNVTITDETAHGATISWDGTSDSYRVMVSETEQSITYSYDFEDGWQGWTTFQGNTTSPHSWMHSTEYTGYDSNGNQIVPECHNSSSGMMLSESYISAATSGGSGQTVTPDNYLVSPQIQLGGSITFYAASRMSNYPAEKFSVMVSESGNTSASNFTHTELTVTLSDNSWHEYTVDLSAYSGLGYVAIRHFDCTDQHLLYIDDITIERGPTATSWMIYDVDASPFVLYDAANIHLESTYSVQVKGFCGDEESNLSPIVSFTTTMACPAPTNVTVTDETPHGATISWNGTSDSYIVNVQQVGFMYDFESAEPWTITDFSPCSVYDGDQAAVYGMNDCDFENESGDDPVAMSCIAFQNGKTDYLYSHSGNAFGVMICPRASTEVAADDWFILPAITIGDNYVFSFWGREIKTDWGAETINVGIYDENNPGSFSSYLTNGQNISISGLDWTQYSFDLSAYRNQTIRLAINYVSNDIFGFMFDDIYVGCNAWDYTFTDVTSPFVLYDAANIHPESTYNVQVIGICGDEESHPSATTSFTTIIACPAPTNLAVVENSVTGHDATVTWNGTGEGYNVYLGTVGTAAELMNVNFSNGIPSNWSNSSSYPWTVTDGYIKSSNAGVASSTSSISVTVTFPADGTIEFDAECMGEGTSTYWDHCDFLIDDATQLNAGGNISGWNHYSYEVTAGQHTFTWSYTKDGSVDPTGDYFAIDNVVMTSSSIVWGDPIYAESTEYTFHGLASETTYFVKVQSDCGVDGLSAESNSVTFTTEISCPAPTGLNVSDISGHGATASWNKMATQATGSVTFNYVCIASGDTLNWDNASIVVDNMDDPNPPTVNLSGLTPETEYTFYLRRDCGDDDYSAVLSTTFTTDVTCPAPSELAVVDNSITGHGATLTWTGYSDSYIVKYRTPEYIDGISEEFGTSIPSGWEMYTGLLNNGTATMASATYGWSFGTNNGVFDNHARVNIYGNYQRWLVMPTITVPAASGFSFDIALTAYSGSSVPAPATTGTDDKFMVLISTDNMATWTTLREWNNSGSSYVYNNIANTAAGENVSIDLSEFAGRNVRIAFYGESTESNADNNLHIDNVTLGALVPAGEWQTVTADSTSITLTGLAPETLYEVVVQGDCGEEGLSAESEPITFTTDISCPAPTPLDATEVTSNSAVLNWTGDAESYNVSYYKTFFFENFESDEDFHSLWTVYHQGDPESWVWEIENPHDNSADLSAHSGIFAAVAYSDVNIHADNWLVSPQIQFPSQTTLKFWVSRSTYDDAQDEYEVLLSTTGNAIEDFDIVLKEKSAASSTWTEVSIDLSEYDGQQCYIAIRHEFTNGFFIMVDDFGIFGWSEPIATTDNSLLIEDLLPETEYQWKVQANCGEVDGLSQWSNIGNFTTLRACPVPFDLSATQETAYGATIAWTGYSESYNVWVGQLEMATINYDFEDNVISTDFTNDATYPWTAVANNHSGAYCAKSGNSLIGANSTTSAMQLEVELESAGTLSFSGKVSSESSWDKAYFSIDGIVQSNLNGISGNGAWIDYEYSLAAGTHTLRWYYTKDTSNDNYDDCFYVDDITIESDVLLSEMNYTATESPFILNDESYILPETTYLVKVKGICGEEETEYSEAIAFTTLDENTKIFVIEGEWSNGDNWVPVGVPTIDENVILRAEATVFDVAEANNITIEGNATLTIEDGGQLKTNSDVTATMKKFVIGYGTDYVGTNNGYYLMTLPTAAPIAAADAGLLTEESDYDLYSWDRTATDEEWQNNHDGIDLQNGTGFLYANRDDMEMLFTATLRNSSEPVVVTPAYDEVEHGGWNLCGNPFPCEAYITTDAEGMAFYRLIGNELVPIDWAIAPMEAFFVKATAAGQTFTISREAPEGFKALTNGNTNRFKVKFVTK